MLDYSEISDVSSTLIPELRHFMTASGTVARGGSIIEMRPTKHRSFSGKFPLSASNGYPGPYSEAGSTN